MKMCVIFCRSCFLFSQGFYEKPPCTPQKCSSDHVFISIDLVINYSFLDTLTCSLIELLSQTFHYPFCKLSENRRSLLKRAYLQPSELRAQYEFGLPFLFILSREYLIKVMQQRCDAKEMTRVVNVTITFIYYPIEFMFCPL